MLIDTHCHLANPKLAPALDAVLARARAADVRAVLCACADLDEGAQALALAHAHAELYATAGIHPHEAKDAPPDYLAQLTRLASDARNVAIGEIGLDYHYDFSPRPDQQRVLAEQLGLAKSLHKPVVIHTREAFADTLAIVREAGVDCTRIVLHSFSEDLPAARQAIDRGMFISFSGIVTFKKSQPLQEAAKFVPADRLFVETDGPFLSPEPVRKMKINEPANVVHTARRLAELRNCDPQELSRQTTANACGFFGIPLPA